MLVLFGKYKESARLIAGAALLVTGIVWHMVLVIVAGGALLAWGAQRMLAARRSR